MSVHVSSWVWAQVVGDPEAKLVLLKLADQANDDGECWPTRRTIAQACETSVSTVRRRLDYLVTRNMLVVESRQRGNGLKTSNLYTIPYRRLTGEPSTAQQAGPRSAHIEEPTVGSRRVNHPEPSLEPSENQEHATRVYTKLEQEREDRLIAEAEELLHPETIADSKAENAAQLAKLRSELRL